MPTTLSGTTPTVAGPDNERIFPFADVTVANSDGAVSYHLEVAVRSGSGTIGGGDFSRPYDIVFNGTLAEVQARLRALALDPAINAVAPGQTTTTVISASVSDGSSTTATSSTVTVTSVNDAPVIYGTSSGQAARAGALFLPFSRAGVNEADTGQTETLEISFPAGAGTLAGGGFTQVSPGLFRLTAAPNNHSIPLQFVTFTPTPGMEGVVRFTVTATDGIATTSDSRTSVVVTTGPAPANTPPAISGVGPSDAVGGVAIRPFSAVVLSDPDAEQLELVIVSFAATAGVLSGGGFTGGNGYYTFEGSISQAQAAVRAATFTPTIGQAGAVNLRLQVADDFSPYTEANARVLVAAPVAPANTPPTLAGGQAAQSTTDKAITAPFATVTVTDPDAGQTETLTITYAAANGRLSGAGFVGQPGSYSGAFASATAAQAALRSLLFTPTENQVAPGGAVTSGFTISVSDGTATATDATTSVVVTSLNDAPVLGGVLPAQTATAGSSIQPFSTAVLTEADVGQTETLTITLSGGAGALSGGAFVQSGNGVYSLAAVTPAAAQAALRAVSFTPAAGASATDTLTLTLQDSPAGAATPTSSTVTVAVTAGAFVNTAPTIGGAATTTADGGVPLTPFAGVVLTDPDAGQTETVTVSFPASAGVLSGGGFTGSAGLYTFAGSLAQAQAALRAAAFTPAVGLLTTTAFTVAVSDGFAQATDSATRVVVLSPGGGGNAGGSGGGGATPAPSPSVRDGLLVELQNLTRALAGGADAQNPAHPIYAQMQAGKAIIARYDAGSLSLAEAETALGHLVDGTTGVAVAEYAFFTGRTPTLAGLNYLVHSPDNLTDLNDAYYARFSTENRFINLAVGLGTPGGVGAAAFADTYASLSLTDAVARAYRAVFGTPPADGKVDAILDTLVPDGLGGMETRAQYFAQYGGDGPQGIGTKAAAVGFLLSVAVAGEIGVYGVAEAHYAQALAHGAVPPLDTEFALTYGRDISVVGQPLLDATLTG